MCPSVKLCAFFFCRANERRFNSNNKSRKQQRRNERKKSREKKEEETAKAIKCNKWNGTVHTHTITYTHAQNFCAIQIKITKCIYILLLCYSGLCFVFKRPANSLLFECASSKKKKIIKKRKHTTQHTQQRINKRKTTKSLAISTYEQEIVCLIEKEKKYRKPFIAAIYLMIVCNGALNWDAKWRENKNKTNASYYRIHFRFVQRLLSGASIEFITYFTPNHLVLPPFSLLKSSVGRWFHQKERKTEADVKIESHCYVYLSSFLMLLIHWRVTLFGHSNFSNVF